MLFRSNKAPPVPPMMQAPNKAPPVSPMMQTPPMAPLVMKLTNEVEEQEEQKQEEQKQEEQEIPPNPLKLVFPEKIEKKIKIVGGEVLEGQMCYGRYSKEGIYYYGTIEKIEEDKVQFRFFDGNTDFVAKNKLVMPEIASDKMQSFANWENQGNYYPCTIVSKQDSQFLIRYDEEENREDRLPYEQIRFVKW